MTEWEQSQVPLLRFREFRGAWTATPLSQLFASLDAGVSVNSGDRPALHTEKGILKTSCVSDGVFDPSENKVVFEPHEINRLQEPVKADTIIISRMNTPALVGANALVKEDWNNLFLPDRLWAGKVEEGASAAWLGLAMADRRTRQKLSDLASGTSGSMKNISKREVLALTLLAPTLPEQQKIGAFFGAVDERIGLLRRRRRGLEQYKRGLMQRFFSQSIRFKREDGSAFPDWEVKEFSDFVKRVPDKFNPISGSTYPTTIELENIEAGTGRVLNFLTLDDQQSIKSVFRAGDILFGKLRPYLRKFWLADRDGICSSEIWVLRARDADTEFVYYLLQTDGFMRAVNQSSGSKMPRADWSVVAASVYALPHPDEQRKIAGFLSALDGKIAAVVAKIDAMQAFKKGLLQQMLV
jgi:Type I restriction modification DNA specificity domain